MRTKLLIVDDSRIFRSAIEASVAGHDDIEVIGSVRNGVNAIEFIRSSPPDLVTLDVEMPGMDGLETLKAIQKINAANTGARPIGVIMLSSHTQKGADITIKALEMGAFDFIPKPENQDLKENIAALRLRLVVKIRYFASKRISHAPAEPLAFKPPTLEIKSQSRVSSNIRAILIGVSTGGPRALTEMLPPLCEEVNVPIFIVQHMPSTFTQSLSRSLNAKCRHSVIESVNNDVVKEQYVYIAPGGRHLLLRESRNIVKTVIGNQPPENGFKPSVDNLFRSGAFVFGKDVIAMILTGMGTDGTEGARILKRAGAFIIAQDEESSVVWGMPGSAKTSGYVDKVLPLNRIPDAVMALMLNKKLD